MTSLVRFSLYINFILEKIKKIIKQTMKKKHNHYKEDHILGFLNFKTEGEIH